MCEEIDSTLNTSVDSADMTFQTAISDDFSMTNNSSSSGDCLVMTTNSSCNSDGNETILCESTDTSKRRASNTEKSPFLTHVVSDSDVGLLQVPEVNGATFCPPNSLVASSLDVTGSSLDPPPSLPVDLSTPKKKVSLRKLNFSSHSPPASTQSASGSGLSLLYPSVSDQAQLNRRMLGTTEDDMFQPDSPSYTMQRMGIVPQPSTSQHNQQQELTGSSKFFSSPSLSVSGSSNTAVATVDINLQVNETLPQQPLESVVRDSDLLFGTFFNVRFEMEVEGRATPSIVTTDVHIRAQSTSEFVNTSALRESRSTFDPVYNSRVRDMFNEVTHAAPGTEIENVARQLAMIGDDINARYGDRLDAIIRSLGYDQSPFDMFKQVASAIFDRGPTKWGSIVALFYFGFRLALDRIRQGIAGAIRMVIDGLCDFCCRSNIFSWIARQGGWFIMTKLRTPSHSIPDQSTSIDDFDGDSSSITFDKGLLATLSELISWRPQIPSDLVPEHVLGVGAVVLAVGVLSLVVSLVRRFR